jgi:hypothetical protein
MSVNRALLLVVALSCLFFATPLAVYSQSVSTGTVTGTVTDPSGAVIAGADVTLTDLSTHDSRKVVTNKDGHYILVNIPPGIYDVTISKSGFTTEKIPHQEVTVGQALTLDAKLAIGAMTQVIEVQPTAGSELQTMNSTVGTAYTGAALEALPSISREVSTFVMLQPGVTPEGSVAGAVYDQNTFQLDGGQNTNDMDGSMNVYTPSFAGDPSGGLIANQFTGNAGGGPSGVLPTPIDSIEEFKVGTTQQTADFNSSAGAQVSMVTRRGRDSWHGTAYEYYLDNNWNANSFDNNAFGTPLPSFHYSRFGGGGGGPLIPKKVLGGKTYIFANYEGFRWPNSSSLLRDTPGPGMRLGLLSLAVCTAACGTANEVDTPKVFNLNPTATTYPSSAPALGALVPGTTYPSATAQAACGGVSCDPRNLGISPTMQALWALMPQGNITNACGGTVCDGVNVLGFNGNVGIPQTSNFGVIRMDHDFGDKWHFFGSYRYYHLKRATTNQVDLTSAGLTALANRPQVPWFYVAGITTNISSNLTNDFHYSYLRNWWLWGTAGAIPQLAGLGAALEPNGESGTNPGAGVAGTGMLAPYNVNTQSVRTRFWNGHDQMIRDDMTKLSGNHLFQFGGTYQHNYNQHQRSDNGGGINYFPVDQLASGAGDNSLNMSGFNPVASSATTVWNKDYANVLGILSIDQIVFTRSGPQLTLNPPLTPVEDRSVIPYYNVYFTDSWHVKPTFTFTYGLAWTLEMPPVEANGEQIDLVDASNQLISFQSYINTRKADALIGQNFNPTLGFTLVGNAEGGRKYPYNPYYGSFSPRVAAAWSPSFDSGILGNLVGRNKTVVRGGFSIIYGRLNGVDLVLVPLLGTGLLQPVQCVNPLINGTCGAGAGTPANSFRVGPTAGGWDGLTGPLASASATLPQPDFPGVNNVNAATSSVLDPNFRPNRSYEFDLTIQRQLSSKIMLEAGYIGRIIRNEYQPIDLNAVPYMFTEGNQSFANAYGNLVMEYCGGNAGLAGGSGGAFGGCNGAPGGVPRATVTPQPFFEAPQTFGGPASAYCTGFASCTAAVAFKEGQPKSAACPACGGDRRLSRQFVWSMWSDLDKSFLFGPTMENTPRVGGPLACGTPAVPTTCGANGQLTSGVATNASVGYGNYNALFVTVRTSDWHGLTMQSNFTYGKALGTGATVQATSEYTAVDPYQLSRGYGLQNWDRKFVYNIFVVYQPPFYKSQHGIAGRLLGGWSFSPIFVIGSGLPVTMLTSSALGSPGFGAQAFGEGDGVNYGAYENAVLIPGCVNNFGSSRHNNVPGTGGVGAGGPFAISEYTNPQAVMNCFRNPVLGIDNGHNGGNGSTMRGLPFWNTDAEISKKINITERFSGEFTVIATNVFNHIQLLDPTNAMNDPGDFGQLESSGNQPRKLEFGFRLRF